MRHHEGLTKQREKPIEEERLVPGRRDLRRTLYRKEKDSAALPLPVVKETPA